MDPHANLEEQRELAAALANNEWSPDARRLAELVAALDEWRLNDGFDPYLPEIPEGAVPTHVQALALGRFLRGHFQHDDPIMRAATVSRGGAGLPGSYLYVRFNDGYEGGIDRDGRVST